MAFAIFSAANALVQADMLTEDDVFGDIPVVTGVSHFPQKISEAPTSVSIIDRSMIDASAAVEIVDLFRLIPGFQVYYPHYGRPAINYHGYPQEYSYRMEVKVDGRSVYEPSENAVLWATLGVELEDIDYIEVVRGANASADGANATIASINIITQPPVATEGWQLRTVAGDWGTQNLSAVYSGLADSFSYKVSGGYSYSSGFPTNSHYEDEIISANGPYDFDDDVETSYLTMRAIIAPTLYDSIDIQLGYSDSNIDMADSGRSISIEDIIKWDYKSYYLSTAWQRQLKNNHSFELIFYFNRVDIDAPESYGLLSENLGVDASDVPLIFPGLEDFEILFGLYDSFADRSDLEFRYQGQLGINTRYTLGAATRYDRMRSEFSFGSRDTVEQSAQRLFSNVEIKPSANWTLNAGAIAEYNQRVHGYGSYRLSANYHFNSRHTIRLAYNNGERSPGLYEANQNSSVTRAGYLLDIDTFSPDDLGVEGFESQEVTYYGVMLENTFTVELKLFKEKNRDLVKYTNMKSADYFSDIGFDNGDFTLRTNSAWLDTQGFETQIKYQPSLHWLVNFQYSYSENEGSWKRQVFADGSINYQDWSEIIPVQMGSLTTGYFFNSGFETSFILYYQDEVDWEQGDYADDYYRVDIRLAKRVVMQNSEALVELVAQNVFNETYTEFHRLNQYSSRYLLRFGLKF